MKNITYYPEHRKVYTGKEVVEFYCGETLTSLAILLLEYEDGNVTLQELYTVLAQNMTPERVESLI